MTIWEFAKKAGVSIATISRAMNPQTRHQVSPATLERLEFLAKKYTYTPNPSAQHLRGSSFKTIGVLLPHLGGIFFSDYYAKVLAGVADALLTTDYRFKVILLKPKESKWDQHNFRVSESVDGLIVTHWPNFFSEASVLEKLKLPCVVINDPQRNIKAYFSTGDNRMGGHLAARYLQSKGHRRVAVFTGRTWSGDSRMRFRGFQATFKKLSPECRIEVLQGDYQEKKAEELTEHLVKTRPDITAIFCCNDLMACGVLKKLKELDIRCPEDISVIGYDDDQRAQTSQPPLTTVRVPLYDLTKDATERLVKHLQNNGEKKVFFGERVFPVEIVERESVAKLGQAKSPAGHRRARPAKLFDKSGNPTS